MIGVLTEVVCLVDETQSDVFSNDLISWSDISDYEIVMFCWVGVLNLCMLYETKERISRQIFMKIWIMADTTFGLCRFVSVLYDAIKKQRFAWRTSPIVRSVLSTKLFIVFPWNSAEFFEKFEQLRVSW